MRFCKATKKDSAEILALYRSCVGNDGCLWDEEYPDARCIEEDLARSMLYVLRDERGILACASVGEDDEDHADMAGWSEGGKPCGVSRVASRPDLRGRGYASLVLRMALANCRAQGYDRAQLLVSPLNPAAMRLYEHLGFFAVGETQAYGFDWLMMERTLEGCE